MNSTPFHIKPVILCGGSGTRLWPMSRKQFPKQFLPLVSGDHSLLQDTMLRANAVSDGTGAIVVCNEEHRFLVADQLSAIHATALQVLEPAGRNTAAAVAAAAIAVEAEDPVLLVLSSDHAIGDLEAFREAARHAAELADKGFLVTFGIQPTHPETGFGYIERGAPIEGSPVAYRIARFVEKPPAEQARALIDTGRAYWNSGMFAFRASRLIEELGKFRPDILAAARKSVITASRDLGFMRLGQDAFLACPSEALDRAVMERTDQAAVIPATFSWSDVGSWMALWEISPKDAKGNAVHGDVRLKDTRDSLVFSNHRLVATLGVEQLVIVETADWTRLVQMWPLARSACVFRPNTSAQRKPARSAGIPPRLGACSDGRQAREWMSSAGSWSTPTWLGSGCRHEGNHSCRGIRYTVVSGHAGRVQATAPHLR